MLAIIPPRDGRLVLRLISDGQPGLPFREADCMCEMIFEALGPDYPLLDVSPAWVGTRLHVTVATGMTSAQWMALLSDVWVILADFDHAFNLGFRLPAGYRMAARAA